MGAAAAGGLLGMGAIVPLQVLALPFLDKHQGLL
jgi:hypothetical protein